MRESFEMATGTVTGKLHMASGKNNQDGFYTIYADDFMIGVVSDGCGSEPNSEVGAKLGCRMIAEIIYKRVDLFQNSGLKINEILTPKFWENTEKELCRQLRQLSDILGEDAIANFFLFTLVGFVMAKTESLFFSLGDGIVIVNGEITILGPFPDNAPPYLGYNILLEESVKPKNKIAIQKILDTRDVESVLIGTDGAMHLIKAESEKISGKDELVGSISQFWTKKCFFENPDMVRRRLAIINRTYTKFDREKDNLTREYGHLPDDTTLIVVRRKETKQD